MPPHSPPLRQPPQGGAKPPPANSRLRASRPRKSKGRAQTASAGEPPAPRQFASRQAICATVQAILDARKLYLDASLADLYDELAMPSELRKAHQENDRAVMAAYGFPKGMTESECVAELFRRYQVLVAAEKGGQR